MSRVNLPPEGHKRRCDSRARSARRRENESCRAALQYLYVTANCVTVGPACVYMQRVRRREREREREREIVKRDIHDNMCFTPGVQLGSG